MADFSIHTYTDRVAFTSEGIALVGHLRLPPGAAAAPAAAPAVVLTGPFTGVKEQVVAGYAEELPAVAPDGGEAAMGGDEPYAYYGTARSASPHWENRVTRGSLHSLMTFDALGAAPLLGATPLLVVHGRTDAYCAPELAGELHAGATGPKEIRWLDTSEHIDLYDNEPHVAEAVTTTVDFLRRYLCSTHVGVHL